MMMRRRARAYALQMLYQLDTLGALARPVAGPAATAALEAAMGRFWGTFAAVEAEARGLCERLVAGIAAEVAGLDAALSELSHRWRLDRMATVDRNLLRLAAYEILFCPDIPRAASINEAVELAKRFGGGESAAFVNGILDQLAAPTAPAWPHGVGQTDPAPALG